MRSAVLVTGASRGFGRCLALDFVRELASSHLDLFLWARDEDDLKETLQLAQEAQESVQQAEELRGFIQTVDLSNSADYSNKLDALLAQLSEERYDNVFLVHNAGALGALGFAQECPSPDEMARHFELNVTSVMWLNKRFLDVFGASRREVTKPAMSQVLHGETKLVIVNVSSRSAIAPYPTLSQYCTAKAAREMHFRVLAAEQSGCNKVKVLSYSPGAMDTEMQRTMRESPLMAPELTKWFVEMKEQGTLVPTQQSSHRGVVVAVNGDFESGKHVTFADFNCV
ncbi:hypothetical protein V7S43_017944 [Phytophthora oleae]|uniref:Sepiapterin reductase n=1 Tax=Phytophthora oleae TaxID=2107226 RepID=A0ABD3ERQ6_9STRA